MAKTDRDIVKLIFKKCARMVVRNRSNQWLFALSLLLVYGGLLLMWALTSSQSMSYLSSQPYAQLKFDFACRPAVSGESDAARSSWLAVYRSLLPNVSANMHCAPLAAEDESEASLTPSHVLLRWLYTGSPLGDDDKSSLRLLELLSSIMMNGLPLVGIDEFVRISDGANRLLGDGLQEKLMSSSAVREQFDGFLHVREKRLILSPDSPCTREFVTFMRNTSRVFADLQVEVRSDLEAVLRSPRCCADVWAVVELSPATDSEDEEGGEGWEGTDNATHTQYCRMNVNVRNASDDWASSVEIPLEELQLWTRSARPAVTIRMHPSAVPDTRNYEWTPLKRVPSRLQSGELLYFSSGFLSLQLELQRFILWKQWGAQPALSTRNAKLQGSFLQSNRRMFDVAAAIVNASSREQLRDDLRRLEQQQTRELGHYEGGSVHFPLFHRAFPTREYTENLFWHLFGTLMTIALIIFFALPAAIALGEFKREWSEGQLDMLSTLPAVTLLHSAVAWCAVCAAGVLVLAALGVFFFRVILVRSSILLPVLGLFLLGVALAPFGVLLAVFISKADTLVLAIPAFSFVSMLPGLIYFDLAFDTQRSLWVELLLCLCPPSAAALLLRLCFSNEALGISVGWFHRAPVSHTWALTYIALLALDVCLWSVVAALAMLSFEPRKAARVIPLLARAQRHCGRCWTRCRSLAHWSQRSGYRAIDDTLSDSEESENESENDADDKQVQDNDGEVVDDQAISIAALCKSYSAAGNTISVLANMHATLRRRRVTVLLGSNGAGKTTLMRILAGLDREYSGCVHMHCEEKNLKNKRRKKRSTMSRHVGWCPQNDALFTNLTVREHLLFFDDLLAISDARSPSHIDGGLDGETHVDDKRERIAFLLQSLAMSEHANKIASHLSGGMKRRLSLALALVGEPLILLLDEPTSGCDSWTREVVRREILRRKACAAVVVSTHHSDDVEVLADRVWFLNERHLVLDSDVESLFPSATKNSNSSANDHHRAVKFSTSSLFIKTQFVRVFGASLSLVLQPIGMMNDAPPFVWSVPPCYMPQLISFVQHLDSLRETDWALEHLTVFSAISAFYGSESTEQSFRARNEEAPIQGGKKRSGSHRTNAHIDTDSESSALSSLRGMLMMRAMDARKHWRSFFVSHALLPFLVVFLLALACRDASHPKVLLTSENLHGLGELSVSAPLSAPPLSSSSVHEIAKETLAKQLPSASATWTQRRSSDDMWMWLFREYYNHSQHRWGAAVMDDTLPQWVESSIAIDARDIALNVSEVMAEMQSSQGRVCERNQSVYSSAFAPSLSSSHSHHSSPERNRRGSPPLSFCDPQPAFDVSLQQQRQTDDTLRSASLLVRSRERLTSNITLLSNVTSDHAAPIFVKEVLEPLGDAYTRLHTQTNGSMSALGVVADYDLFSFPLPDNNAVSKKYLERGFLGSTIAMMCLLLCCVSCAKFVTKLNASRMKRQLYLSGVAPWVFLLSNWLCDALRIFVAQSAILLGIYCGGTPVSAFFFFAPPSYGLLAVLSCALFAMAVVSSSFATVWLWEDRLASQLFLLVTTVSGGVFLKMYLDRHHSPLCDVLAVLCIAISPTFAFSTVMFDLFKAYAQSALKSSHTHEVLALMAKRLVRVRFCCGMLFLQAVLYFWLCLAIEKYHKVLSSFVLSFRWSLSAQWMCADVRNMLSETESLPLWQGDNEDEGHRDDKLRADPFAEMTTSAGRRMRDELIAHPDYRVGVFPFITRSAYKLAARKHKAPSEWGSSASPHDKDVEMRLLPSVRRPSIPHDNDMIHLQDVSVSGHAPDHLALCNVSLQLPASRRVAVMAMNGGGKTTLFETLALASRLPINGRVRLFGLDVIRDHDAICATHTVGYVSQEDSLLDFLTVRETLRVFCAVKNVDLDDALGSAQGLLPGKYNDYPVCALSGGTKKKLALKLANLRTPRLLLLDECTTGVDPIAADSIVQHLLRNVQRQAQCVHGQGLLFASHRVDEAFSVCDEVLMLVGGQLFLQGPSSAFLELANKYYQVDIFLRDEQSEDHAHDALEAFIVRLMESINGKSNIERIVAYNHNLIRLTFRKSQVSLTKLWNKLDMWRYHGYIVKYLFRTMEMEEILATILVASKNESS